MSGVGAATGAVAGLVAITPASGFVGPMGAIAVGLGAGVLTFYAVRIRHKFGFDDALEVMAVHGVGGIWGAIATGIFAMAVINNEGVAEAVGLVDGDAGVLVTNLIAVLATIAYSFIVTFVILKILDVIPGLGLRADEADEDAGLDIALHGERAYVGDGAD
jgi:Amt family ammonium transporter